ncbi:hypothetical protein WN943_006680 [Citrus x changshan-huyou]
MARSSRLGHNQLTNAKKHYRVRKRVGLKYVEIRMKTEIGKVHRQIYVASQSEEDTSLKRN